MERDRAWAQVRGNLGPGGGLGRSSEAECLASMGGSGDQG